MAQPPGPTLGVLFNREEQLHNENQELRKETNEARKETALAREEMAALRIQMASHGDKRPERKKGPDPVPFDGKPGTLDDFLVLCRMKFQGEARTYASDEDKVLYAGQNLRGAALAWFAPFQYPSSPEVQTFQSWEDFVSRIQSAYGTHDRKRAAGKALWSLRQTGSVIEYTTEFQKLAAHLGWQDSPLCTAYYEGLSSSIREHLINFESPDYPTLVHHAQLVDNNLRDLRKPQLNKTTRFPYYPKMMEAPRQVVTTGPTPMDLDATVQTRPPLTREQKQHRREKNLCLYCGKPGHTIAQCRSKGKGSPGNS